MAAWLSGITRAQWIILGAAWLGWVFDIADTALFNFAKSPMVTELLGGPEAYKQSGALVEGQIQTIFIIGWAIGGLIFGALADRFGRTRVMIATILMYSAFTGLTALCHTWQQVAAVRFLTGLGIGGEWAAGAALVAEVFPDKARPTAAAILQTAAAFGPVFAGLANQGLAGESWRWLFVVGIAPALITVFIRFYVREPPRTALLLPQERKPLFAPVKELMSNAIWRRNAIVAMIIGLVGIAGAGNLSFWLPNLITEASQGLSAAVIADRKSYATYTMHIGTLLGVFFFPWFCQLVGRKPAFATFFVAAPVSVALALYAGSDYQRLLLMAPLMSFFLIGLSAGFGLYFPELFATRVRATGCGLAYNTARIGQAPLPWITGQLIVGSAHGSAARGVLFASAIYVVGLIALPFAPETKGKPLPQD